MVVDCKKINFVFILNQFFIVRTILCATFNDLSQTTTICINCYYSLHFHVHNNNCSKDLYNRDLQTTIILFTRHVPSHTTNWIISESALSALLCLLYCRLSSIMNALGAECLYQVAFSVVFACQHMFIRFFILHFVVACLLLKPIIFVFGVFVYHFKNTISISTTIFFY